MCLVRVFVIGFKEFIFQVLWFSLHFRSLFRHFHEDQIPLAVSAPCPISSVTIEFWFDVFVVVMQYR